MSTQYFDEESISDSQHLLPAETYSHEPISEKKEEKVHKQTKDKTLTRERRKNLIGLVLVF